MGRRFILAVATLVVAVAVPAPTADAHAALSSSSPADGDVLTEVVSSVSLTFTESVQPSASGYAIALAGAELPHEAATTDGATWTLTFEPLHRGAVTVTYDVISADGHVIAGALAFTVDAPAPLTTTAPPVTGAPTSPSAPSSTPPLTTAPVASTPITSPTLVAVAPPPAPIAAPPLAAGDDGTSPVVWVLLAIGAAALLGVSGWWVARRRVT